MEDDQVKGENLLDLDQLFNYIKNLEADQETKITKQLLKAKSGEFDIESIHHISLKHYGELL